MKNGILFFVLWVILLGCSSKVEKSPKPTVLKPFYLGGDLSYLNELLDCGAEFRSEGKKVDPYQFFGEKGANISRLRLWHTPDWKNGYSDYADVEKAIKRSKDEGMSVLLDFHYSDTWADPQHQIIPQAWEGITDLNVLADSLYKYTYQTLSKLHVQDLVPEFVQVGNEINIEIMQDSAKMVVDTIHWARNITLINAGLQAVEDFSLQQDIPIGKMIHIAQPENALWWFGKATQHGLGDYDWIGISYYPKWSSYGLDNLSIAIDSLIKTYDKQFMIVETAYPYTMNNVDPAHNILGEDALIAGYPATEEGQYQFMKKLVEITREAEGKGVVYWEPGWVTSDCSTLWGQGSHWDNATFFDASRDNEALKVFEVFSVK